MTLLPETSQFSQPLSRRGFLRGLALVGACAATSSILAGCTSPAQQTQQQAVPAVFRWGQGSSKQPFDMQRANSIQASSVAEAVVDPLLWWNENNQLEPVLLTKMPEWNKDFTQLSCELKPNVVFSNGEPLTVEDVQYSFTRMFKPQTKGVNTNYFDAIKGAKDMLAGKADTLSGFVMLDDTHFRFDLEEPFVQFPYNLGLAYAGIFPRQACEDAGDSWGREGKLIGSGPYKLTQADDSLVVLEPNEHWHGGKPTLDKVEVHFYDEPSTMLMAFSKGDIHACPLASSFVDQYKQDAQVKDDIHTYHPLGTSFISLNVKEPALQDVRVRKALSLAINRQEFVDTLQSGSGKVCTCFLHPQIPGSYSDLGEYPYDPERARQLIAEAKAEDLQLTAKCRSANSQKILTAIQAYWKAIGVDLVVERQDAGAWFRDWKEGNIQVNYLNWSPLYPDADNHMNTYYNSKNSGTRSSFYANPRFDALMNEARKECNVDKRAELYTQADKLLTWEDYACIPVFWPDEHFVAKTEVSMTIGNITPRFNQVELKPENQ